MKRLLSIILPVCLWMTGQSCSNEDQAKLAQPEATADSMATRDPLPLAKAPTATVTRLDETTALRLIRLSTACTRKEYPNKPGHIYDGDSTVVPPQTATPAFFGCFDWHSAVHGHWSMVHVLALYPNIEVAKDIESILDEHLNERALATELAFFQTPRNATFERPYGWGWLLRLQTELLQWNDPRAIRWATALKPLADHVASSFANYLKRLSRPVREGTHANTAFALVHAYDFAVIANNSDFKSLIISSSKRFYANDIDCPASYEPSGEDFISPCLVEADLMRRVLEPADYSKWLEGFLPGLSKPEPFVLEEVPQVLDAKDPRIGHLIGLGFQRGQSALSIAQGLPPDDPRAIRLRNLAEKHGQAALELVSSSGYGGEHWLATFALYYFRQMTME